jgi:aryl-alcohol dehydrogenase-like predicted oxidoreductase
MVMKDKLVIGSANFGLEYGIANKRKLSEAAVSEILEFAHAQGVWGIDTARAYGDAEKVIGNFFAGHGKIFNVITKLPNNEYRSAKDVEQEIIDSLKNMNIAHIDYLLLHSYESLRLYGKTVIPVLQSLRQDKVIGHFGVSVYHPDEVEYILKEVKDSMAIEFPINLFDQRFLKNSLLRIIKETGNYLFARSIFLQGLFFLNEENLNIKFVTVRDKIIKIKEISNEYHISPECIAILFVVTNPWIDKVIIGVDNRNQVMTNIECFTKENLNKFEKIAHYLFELEVFDENIILPYKWAV